MPGRMAVYRHAWGTWQITVMPGAHGSLPSCLGHLAAMRTQGAEAFVHELVATPGLAPQERGSPKVVPRSSGA
eukprot:14839416-Alexandrium_andersonii.AAC.1